ncbi:MAG: flagellar hook assembly protein FlgD [Methylobacteriaceae bacterium]|jgi:flagellar basal-body rod modification protein FlgD|uniref:Basal-body rod modification protein FlgD n=1 Tax=Methylorubrum extorquens TaxID=408 RepID=A0A2N9AY28_METEX|nr:MULTISPECIES: flagellar hook assembly protein FlgD [Methylorubrum]KQO92188.1 flagellar basal body rod modification protein [Methylobacterium sp. Leaf90]KQQ15802.1 flagellar basal body rod modification protein [Methylobacterium sp. Leaf121]MDF9861994.1 flagellar basal-body rod modification protein FlgD [Methylorubrum pseudosasae]MDH6635610.1 flagellar basal-body rod modification protein FlgD [Methylobacterium sp. SuP10 SLI 274]ARO54487.1 flagellar basal body rod modification protein [Methylo
MDVSSTGTTTSTTTAAAAKAATSVASKMNADTFLTLLMAQLQNQDPTKPMDSTEYVGQLATFSQVEQATKTNQKLDSLLTSSFLNQADAIIGRSLTSADGLTSGTVQSVRVTGDGVMAKLTDGREMLLASGISIS